MSNKLSGTLALLTFLLSSASFAAPCIPGRVDMSVVVESSDSLSQFERSLEMLGYSSRINPVIEDGKVILRASEAMATKGIDNQLETKINEVNSSIRVEVINGEICS